MFHRLKKFAYVTFDECVTENNELQRSLDLEVGEEEKQTDVSSVVWVIF